LLIKSEGILLIDQKYLPARISINNGFFQIKETKIYEFIPTGITSIGGLELEIRIKQDDYVSNVGRF
jgi:hypothetical protein